MATVLIELDGTDVTASVILKGAEFTSSARGAAGTCRFRIRDYNQSKMFTVGKELTLTIDGVRKWGGFVMEVHRGYFWDGSPHPCDTPLVPRYFEIIGSDYNVLLNKRVLYDKVHPENFNKLTCFAAGTPDSTVIDYYIANHTDLLADGVTTTMVEHVGTPSVDQCIPNDCNISAQAGQNISSFLRFINFNVGAIWYLDPNKNLVYTDVDTPNAAFGLSDDPVAGEVGCRDLEILYDASDMRNDALVWAAGQGPNQTGLFARRQDATSETTHERWQIANTNLSLICQSSVNQIANSYVYGSPQNKRGGKDDRVSIKATVFVPNFTVAQKVPVRSAVFGYSDVVPIRSERITFPTATEPQYDLVLGFDVDDPWTTVEFWWPQFHWPKCPDGSDPPCISIPPPPPPPNPCAQDASTQCCETFTRTVTTGWGASEFGDTSWTPSTNTYFAVNGTEGVVQNQSSPPFGQHTYISLPISVSVPFEIVTLSRWDRSTPLTPSLNGYWGRTRLTLDTPGGFGSEPFAQPDVFLQWDYEDGTLSGTPESLRVSTQANRQSPPTQYGPATSAAVFTPNAKAQNWVRWRVEATAMYVKAWPSTDPEPLNWTASQTGLTNMPLAYGALNMVMVGGDAFTSGSVVGVQQFFDSLCVVEGIICNGDGSISTTACLGVDNFNRTLTSGWGLADFGLGWTVSSSLLFSVTPGLAQFAGDTSFQSAAMTFPSGSGSTPFEVVAGFKIPAGSSGYMASLYLQDVTSGYYDVDLSREAGGTLACDFYGSHGDGSESDGTTLTGQASGYASDTVMLRLLVDQDLHFRVWLASQAEPTMWSGELTLNGTPSALQRAWVLFGNTNVPVSVTTVDVAQGFDCNGAAVGLGTLQQRYGVSDATVNHSGDSQWYTAPSVADRKLIVQWFGSPTNAYRTYTANIASTPIWSRVNDLEQREWLQIKSGSNVLRAKIDFDQTYGQTGLVDPASTIIGLYTQVPSIGSLSSPQYLGYNAAPLITPYATVLPGEWFDCTVAPTIYASPIGLANDNQSLQGVSNDSIYWASPNNGGADPSYSSPPGDPFSRKTNNIPYEPWIVTIEVYSSTGWVNNKCFGPNPPAADPSCLPRYQCENLTQIAAPPNQPFNDTYWALANGQQFQPSSSEVWVNGLRIRLGYDYDEHYLEGYIQIHAGIVDVYFPATIRACYYTGCYLLTTA